MYVYSNRSKRNLSECHPDLQTIGKVVIKRTMVDFGIHEGGRTKERQLEYFLDGKSSIDPRKYSDEKLIKYGKHIVNDFREFSEALDFHVSENHNGRSLAWNQVHLSYVASVWCTVAIELFRKGEIDHILRWGGDWNMNGVIGFDHALKDYPHVELITPYDAKRRFGFVVNKLI